MEELIRHAFIHVEGLGPHVAEGHYDLIGPNGEIILPRVWDSVIQPAWSISMSMWPMPEPPKPGQFPPGPMRGTRFDSHGRPQGRHGHHHGWRPNPEPPISQMRDSMHGGPPPPPPTNWSGGPPPPAPNVRPPTGVGPGGPPVIVNLTRGLTGSRSRSRRNDKSKVRGWMRKANGFFKSKKEGRLQP
jgi:hypothetical protein